MATRDSRVSSVSGSPTTALMHVSGWYPTRIWPPHACKLHLSYTHGGTATHHVLAKCEYEYANPSSRGASPTTAGKGQVLWTEELAIAITNFLSVIDGSGRYGHDKISPK